MGTAQGDEYARPEHRREVALFQISKFLITNRQYREFVKQTGHPAPAHWAGDNPSAALLEQPVTRISWREAKDYCNWLTSQTGIGYRLPTEAEWEYLARNRDKYGINEILTKYLEWTDDEFRLYPGAKVKLPEQLANTRTYIFRGRGDEKAIEPATLRFWQKDDYSESDLGFRVAVSGATNQPE
jgi:formylglycine-generating enzyme required for sulfatase activity